MLKGLFSLFMVDATEDRCSRCYHENCIEWDHPFSINRTGNCKICGAFKENRKMFRNRIENGSKWRWSVIKETGDENWIPTKDEWKTAELSGWTWKPNNSTPLVRNEYHPPKKNKFPKNMCPYCGHKKSNCTCGASKK